MVTDKAIVGTLKESDATSGRPKQFIPVPLWDQKLAARGVEYRLRHQNNWLGNFLFKWALRFGVLFLLWGWMARRRGSLGKGFLNIGNQVHAHPDSRPWSGISVASIDHSLPPRNRGYCYGGVLNSPG